MLANLWLMEAVPQRISSLTSPVTEGVRFGSNQTWQLSMIRIKCLRESSSLKLCKMDRAQYNFRICRPKMPH